MIVGLIFPWFDLGSIDPLKRPLNSHQLLA